MRRYRQSRCGLAILFYFEMEIGMETKLFVGNLSYDTTEEDLRTLFAQAGTVSSVALIIERETGRSKWKWPRVPKQIMLSRCSMDLCWPTGL